MGLPSDSDYNGAIQNPGSCFQDPDLRTGQVELMPALPLPKARSGNFATVYKVITQGKSWAVRCFTRAIPPDQQRRYAEISRAVAASRLPYFVGFTYLPQGIKVGSQWFPIVKMEWASGEPLDSYVQRRLTAPNALSELAVAWVEMTAALERAGIAHGDLQHGNVLVANGALRLVDYDGMFVPSLAGSRAPEIGHRNYQHPLRDEGHFGPWLDHFSSWVVFVSLLGLAVDPGLWQRHRGGDDCLLLRREDFLSPERSTVLDELTSLRDARARAAATLFRSLVAFSPDQVPGIDRGTIPVPGPGPVAAASALPPWISEHLADSHASAPAPYSSSGASGSGAAWLLDHLAGSGSAPVEWGPLTWQRALLGLSPAAAALLSFVTSPHSLHWSASPIIMALVNLAALGAAYGRSAPASARAAAALKESTAREELEGIEVTIRALEAKARANASAATEAQQKLTKAVAKLEASRDAQLEAARQAYHAFADAQGKKRQKIAQEEQNELQRTASAAASKLARAQQELSDLVQREDAEVHRELLKFQETCITDVLRRTPLTSVPAGRRYLDLLHMAGIRSAYDASDSRVASVYGVGPKTESAVRRWRADLINHARGRCNALPSHVEAQIRGRFAQDRARLQGEVAASSAQHQQLVSGVKARFDAQRLALEVGLRTALQDCQARERAAVANYSRETENAAGATRGQVEAVAASAKQTQEELAQPRKQRFDALLRHQFAVRELERLDKAKFSAYLKKIVGLA